MEDLGEIVEESRVDVGGGSGHDDETGSARSNSTKRKGPKKRRSSDRSRSPAQIPTSGQVSEQALESDNGEHVPRGLDGKRGLSPAKASLRPACSLKQDELPANGDLQARFYDHYRKVAEEYDKEFLKKHDEDLNTTLIFAGLFSAVASAFIIDVNSQLQPDPSDETAALLRVLIYKIDNTTFGHNVPTLPQWSGPPRAMVHVQVILFASLAASLFSAFLAMLGKQWLNRYDSADMRGSATERSKNRQQKLDGIIAWYFDYVMESLPLMLQAALLLLGCALSRYLWEINIVVASVIIGVTSFGAIFYVFIVIAGTASASCPYQTPGARISRHVLRHIPLYIRHNLLPAIRSTLSVVSSGCSKLLSGFARYSVTLVVFRGTFVTLDRPWYSVKNVGKVVVYLILAAPMGLVIDCLFLGFIILVPLAFLCRKAYRWSFGRLLRRRVIGTSPASHGMDRRMARLDLRCISWILQTSLEKSVRLAALEHLVLMSKFSHFHPTIVLECFSIFVGCFGVNNNKMTITEGSEEIARASAAGFFDSFLNLAIMDPTSTVLINLRQQYKSMFPRNIDFTGLPFHSTMANIHLLARRFTFAPYISQRSIRTPGHEHLPFSRHIAEVAKVKYQQTQHQKVPRWTLRSAHHLLSLGSVFPPFVIADCLMIIALDMGCDLPDTTNLDESARVERLSNLITQKLETMVEAADQDVIFSKRKAIGALLPYAVLLEQEGHHGMFDAVLRAARTSYSWEFMWYPARSYIAGLLIYEIPPSLNRAVVLASSYVAWDKVSGGEKMVVRWAAAVSVVTYTEEVGQSVVDALLQIAAVNSLRPHIPTNVWEWLKRRPSLPPGCLGRTTGAQMEIVHHVRGFRDIELITSYFLLLWSEWVCHDNSCFQPMQVSIREDFGGTGLERNRKELMERLDHILEELNQGTEHFRKYRPVAIGTHVFYALFEYEQLRETLLEVEKEAMSTLPNPP